MEQEWNENIEQIIEQKSFSELTSADKSVLGEIAESEFTYNSYRSLLTDVVPSFKANSITTSKALDERVLAVAENKKAAWYTSPFVRYSTAAAVVLLLGTTIFWFVNNNVKTEENKVAMNDKTTNSEEKMEKSTYAQDSIISPNESIESKNESSAPKLNQTKEDNDQSSDAPKIPMPVMAEKEAPRIESDYFSGGNENTATVDLSDDEYTLNEVAEEHAEESVVEAEEVMPGYASGSNLKATTARAKTSEGSKNKDVRDEIVGTIHLSKPASDEKDAFDLLTIAF